MKRVTELPKIFVNGYAITLLQKTFLQVSSGSFGASVLAEFEPIGVVVEKEDTRWAMDLQGQTVDEQALRQQCNTSA